MILTYVDWIKESVNLAKPINPGISINYADETMEGLRRSLLDEYIPQAKNKEAETIINRAISTYVYALDKKLKIDEDIIILLSNAIGKTHDELSKEISKKTVDFYNGKQNVIG
jgi:hypothetical protein